MDGLKERLRALRESRGYSQKGLAKRLGCSPAVEVIVRGMRRQNDADCPGK